MEIELTSARPDGSWTWRAAGAREPKGVLDGSLLPAGTKAGDVLKVEADAGIDGIVVTSVLPPKEKQARSDMLELLPSERPFEGVTSQLATRERGERPRRRDGERSERPRRDGDRGQRPRGEGGERPGRPERRERAPRGEGEQRRERRPRPSFTPPPELPQRPKPKRLKPGRSHRNAVLAELPEAQRPVAERVLQGGVPAVRQAVQEQNERLRAEGKEEIPAEGLVTMAEQLLPRLRVAEWLDRADAAERDLAELDLRDLRSVVAASDDPVVARDESTREVAARLKRALVDKQEHELQLWLGDIDAALEVGRVIRALKLAAQPPKAGVPFPGELATRLAQAASASLTADATGERWSAVLEAAAFSPVRAHVEVTSRPEQPGDDVLATVRRLAALLPQIAASFGIEPPPPGKSSPRPLRPTRPAKAPAKQPSTARPVPPPPPAPTPAAPAPETEAVPESEAAPEPDADAIGE